MPRSRLPRLALALLALACGPPAASDAPNVLLVVFDTLRRDHCSLYGYPLDTTPTLRAVAADGAVFDTAYSGASATGPSIATLLTGRFPITHRVVDNGIALPAHERTLAEILRDRGYATAAFVSSFVLDRRFGFGQGFAHYDDAFEAATASVAPLGAWEGIELDGAFDRRAAATTDQAIGWLDARPDPQAPFFLFVHYFDPHSPYSPPAGQLLPFAKRVGVRNPATPLFRYDAEIAYADAELGRLLARLDDLGLRDGTLLIVTADHGEGLGDHGYLQHGVFVYEEEVRVPLVARWPGRIEAGRVFPEAVSGVDLVPTILELVGGDPRTSPAGRSLANALRGRAPPSPEPVYLFRRHFEPSFVSRSIHVAGQEYGVREGRWKYIDGPEQGTRELYDLERDAAERENRYYDERQVALRLAARLDAWRRRYERAGEEAPPLGEEERAGLRALGYAE